jgi:hypothetical protein
MSLASYSQTHSSTTQTECLVPCRALQNALIMKEEYEMLKINHAVSTDSIRAMKQIIGKKDELISNKDKEISLMKSNEEAYKGIIKEKDKQIATYERKYKSQVVQKYAGFGFGILAAVAGVIIGL